MRLPKRGEKGFTLIELLIVVAILGVLAAVVIPNVTRFVGSGETEAAETELHNIQLAVTSMMLENGLTEIPLPVAETNNMGEFPDVTATLANKGADADFVTAALLDGHTDTGVLGYVLYGNQIVTDVDGDGTYDSADGDSIDTVNYVTVDMTTSNYLCAADGTVTQP